MLELPRGAARPRGSWPAPGDPDRVLTLLHAHLYAVAYWLAPLSNVGAPLLADLATIRPDPSRSAAPICAPFDLRQHPERASWRNRHPLAFALDISPLWRLARFARSPQIDWAARLVPMRQHPDFAVPPSHSTACHGVRSHPVPVTVVGERSLAPRSILLKHSILLKVRERGGGRRSDTDWMMVRKSYRVRKMRRSA